MDLDKWEYAPDNDSSAFLLREIKKAKMPIETVAKLESGMNRLQNGTAKAAEYDNVRNGVSELRVNANQRWYRVLYGKHNGKFIALSLVIKKTNRLSKQDIDTAIRRLNNYKAR